MPLFMTPAQAPLSSISAPIAWEVLRRENIQTMDQLRAQADRLEQFDGISDRMAQVIRLALAYGASLAEVEAAYYAKLEVMPMAA
jgi:hypothetical protein